MGAVFDTALDLVPLAVALVLLLASWLGRAALAARRGGALGEAVPKTRERDLPRPADAVLPAPRTAHHDAHEPSPPGGRGTRR